MKTSLTKRAVSLLAAFSMMIWMIASALPVMADDMSATFSVSPPSISEGGSISVNVSVKGSDVGDGTSNVMVQGLGSLSGSYTAESVQFTGGSASVSVPSGHITYSGKDAPGYLQVSVNGKSFTSSAVSGLNPTDDGSDNNTTPPPVVVVGTIFNVVEDTAIPTIDAGASKTIIYPITSGSKRISGDVQISAKLPEKLYFTTASTTQTFSFSKEKTQNLELPISADSSLESGTYPITLTVSYKYSGEAKTDTIETYIKVNGKTPTEPGAGQLSVAGYTVTPKSVNAGQKFKVTLTVQNTGTADYKNVLVTLGGLSTETFTMDGTVDSQRISTLKAGASTNLTFSLVSGEKMASGNYNLDVTMTCGEETFSSKVFVPVIGNPEKQDDDTEKPKTESTPQLIIESYNYGEGVTSVIGGEVFTLSAVIRNTGKTAVKNVKITISSAADEETGGAFSPANSSNTFYIDSIAAGGSITETIDLVPKADAKPKSYGVDFAFSYEAIVNEELVTKDVTQTVAIPLTQPDRFEATEPQMYGPVMQGETLSGYVSYVNKGKSTIFNLSVKVEGEGFTTAEAESYIGNVESGASDGYDISINPTQAGTVSGTITFTYEDANGDTKELVKNFQSEVMEYVEPEMPDIMDPDMPVEAEGGMPVWGWIAIAVGGVVVVVIVIVVVKKIVKKKKQAALDAEDDYDDEDTGEQQ